MAAIHARALFCWSFHSPSHLSRVYFSLYRVTPHLVNQNCLDKILNHSLDYDEIFSTYLHYTYL